LLAGKTVSFKDHTMVAGIPASFGTLALEGFVPDIDATVVTRTLGAGASIVGKNTMDGLAGMPGFGQSGDYGRPRNPHKIDHLTGGSSSGSAAALASKQVDISFGGDQGGSIRIPAAWCGTVGLKPTFGLVSHFGIGFGSDQSIDYTGPMAMTVEDTASALQAVAGYDGLDPRQGRSVPKSIDALGGLADGVKGLKIGVVDEGMADPIEPDVRDAVLEAVDELSRAGADIRKVSIPEHLDVSEAQVALGAEGSRAVFQTGFFGAFSRTYYPPLLTAAVNKLYRDQADSLNARTKLQYLIAEYSRRNYHGMVYAKAQNVRQSYIGAYEAALTEVDILAMPTCVNTAPLYEPPASALEALEQAITPSLSATSNAVRNTRPFNYTGHPALAVPCGKSGGLPISLQLIGRFYDDPLLLRAAYAYEHSVDWEDTIGL
jgi:amidase